MCQEEDATHHSGFEDGEKGHETGSAGGLQELDNEGNAFFPKASGGNEDLLTS